ncbi:MAG: tRNA (adenosine(37)-N6)-threonylcarbamoyltransferase complex ATPase subunit type 1 TsaE, partial [Oscillospiraceae bacterium]|nr:tRNA (adenosine(37)-N6)-threonylcarbamoyltransferase complex ATPase subunit type 1 TsaE [Oscillospiraceae bacterium]
MIKFETHSPEETIELASKIGALLRPGDIIAFKGGLGAGKTTFTRAGGFGHRCTTRCRIHRDHCGGSSGSARGRGRDCSPGGSGSARRRSIP